jgi:hypothetical protein
MSSRAHTDVAVERRVRRLAQRKGLSLLFAKKRNSKIDAHGGFMLRSDETMAIVFGNKGYEYSADIDEIEAFLTQSETPD